MLKLMLLVVLMSIPGQAMAYSVVVDDMEARVVGTWIVYSMPPAWNDRFLYSYGAMAQSSVAWTPDLAFAGWYKAYVWYPAGKDKSAFAPYVVNCQDGSYEYYVNQQESGGRWNLLGIHRFAAGNSGNVVLTNNIPPGFVNVAADAVMFELVPEPSGLLALGVGLLGLSFLCLRRILRPRRFF